jgi:hypothetical protein
MQAKGLKPNHIEPKLILVATWAYLDDHRADLVHHGSRATQACREGQQGSPENCVQLPSRCRRMT